MNKLIRQLIVILLGIGLLIATVGCQRSLDDTADATDSSIVITVPRGIGSSKIFNSRDEPYEDPRLSCIKVDALPSTPIIMAVNSSDGLSAISLRFLGADILESSIEIAPAEATFEIERNPSTRNLLISLPQPSPSDIYISSLVYLEVQAAGPAQVNADALSRNGTTTAIQSFDLRLPNSSVSCRDSIPASAG